MNINKNYTFSDSNDVLGQIDSIREFSNTTNREAAYVDTQEINQNGIWNFKNPTEWQERWFLSSNAKDIGTFYLIFALFSGLIRYSIFCFYKIRIKWSRCSIYMQIINYIIV